MISQDMVYQTDLTLFFVFKTPSNLGSEQTSFGLMKVGSHGNDGSAGKYIRVVAKNGGYTTHELTNGTLNNATSGYKLFNNSHYDDWSVGEALATDTKYIFIIRS